MMLMAYLEEVVEDLTNIHHNDRKKVFENSCGYTKLLSLCIERVLSFGMHKSSMWASRNLYECIRAAARDIVIIESYPNIKHDWSTVDILNLSKPGRSRAWIRHAMNQGHLGDSILAMAGNFDFSDNWFQEFSIMRQPRDIKQVYEWLESLSMFEWNLNVNDRGLNNEAMWTDSTPEMLRQKMKLTRVARVKLSPRKSSLESSRTLSSRDANTVGAASRSSFRNSLEDNLNGKVLVEIREASERLSESLTLEVGLPCLAGRMGAPFDSVPDYPDFEKKAVEDEKYLKPEEVMLNGSSSGGDESLEVVLMRGSPSRSDENSEVLLSTSPPNPSPPPSPNLVLPNPTIVKSLSIPSPLDTLRPLGSIPRKVKVSPDSPPSPGRKQLRVLSKGGTPTSPMTSITASPPMGTNSIKSRSLQKFVALQTIDGEINPVRFQGRVQGTGNETNARKHSLDIVLEQEMEKRNNFQFPDPGIFKVEDKEDEKLGKILEKHWEETSMSENVKNPPKHHVLKKTSEPNIKEAIKTATQTTSKNHEDFDSVVLIDIANEQRKVTCSDYFSGQSKIMDMSVYSAKEREKLERELLSGQRPGEQNSGLRASTGVILQLQDKDDIQSLAEKQGGKCFTCGQFMSNPKRCHYSGMLYCVSCHSGKSSIPAKMVMQQDAHPYPVSIASSKHLKAMWEVPCIPLSHVPERYQTKPLQELHKILQQVRLKAPSRKQIEALGRRQYLLHSWDSDYGCFHELTRSGCYGLLTIEDFHRVITEPSMALKEISSLLSTLN